MTDKTAEVYRMVMDDHLCPYGLKTKALLMQSWAHLDGILILRRFRAVLSSFFRKLR